MGFSQKIFLTDEAVPTKFHCQEDRKRRLSPQAGPSRDTSLKRQRKSLVAECLESQSTTETDVESMNQQHDSITVQDTVMLEEIPKTLDMFCYLCLATNKRTFNIYKTDLQYFYESLAHYTVRDSECWMCYICHTRLQQCLRLQQLAVQTRGLVDGQNKIKIEFGLFESLLELTTYKRKNISIAETTVDVKQEPDLKTEPDNYDGKDEVEYLNNTTYNDYEENDEAVIKFREDNQCGNGIRELLSADLNELGPVLRVNIVKLSQNEINKYVNQSPRRHQVTECLDDQAAAKYTDAQNKDDKEMTQKIEDKTGDEVIKQITNGKNGNSEARSCSQKLQSCDGSSKKFVNKLKLLRKYMKTHNIPYTCDYCLKEWKSKSRLLDHIKSVHVEKQFGCDICSKMFTNKAALFSHTIVHTGDRPFSCDICGKSFAHRSTLYNHNKHMHSGTKQFSCNICYRGFSLRSRLNEHMLIHTDENLLTCHICDKKLTKKVYLSEHIKIHTGETPYSCDICLEKFRGKKCLRKHIRMIHSNTSFSCDVCQKKFAYESNLKRHAKVHTYDQRHSCNMCPEEFIHLRDLNRHRKVVHKAYPYSCVVCNVKFSLISELKVHAKVHTGIDPLKPYSCPICAKKFMKLFCFKRHIRDVHRQIILYTCNICQKRFPSVNRLNGHKLSMHIEN
ncbi:zinc finger protein 468-like isoform X2 [Aricia agestis]|nr:zinc finger protein 468-like isoform X2 [Aricia agestis]XP_041986012.1 zinc finger protein 468-like isoform X2 [Aricia agestis]